MTTLDNSLEDVLNEEELNLSKEGHKAKLKEHMELLFREYIKLQVIYTQLYSDLDELTYLKARVDTPEGGLYFWSFMHVDGPKIKLKDKDGGSEEADYCNDNAVFFKESPFLSRLNEWILNKSTPSYGEFNNIVEYINCLEKKIYELENKGIRKDG